GSVVAGSGGDDNGYSIFAQRFMPAPPGYTMTTTTTTRTTRTTTSTTRTTTTLAPATTTTLPAVKPPACDTMTGVAAARCVFDRDPPRVARTWSPEPSRTASRRGAARPGRGGNAEGRQAAPQEGRRQPQEGEEARQKAQRAADPISAPCGDALHAFVDDMTTRLRGATP